MTVRCRLAERLGHLEQLRVYWGDDCPNNLGTGQRGYHDARSTLHVHPAGSDPERVVRDVGLLDLPDNRWPEACDFCGALVPSKVTRRQHFWDDQWDTPSGRLEPGCMYYSTWHEPFACQYWNDCDGTHLRVVLPDLLHWDIDSRASNCKDPQNRQHRCWRRTGDPPNVTANVGECKSDGGSIRTNNYHGTLRSGVLEPA